MKKRRHAVKLSYRGLRRRHACFRELYARTGDGTTTAIGNKTPPSSTTRPATILSPTAQSIAALSGKNPIYVSGLALAMDGGVAAERQLSPGAAHEKRLHEMGPMPIAGMGRLSRDA